MPTFCGAIDGRTRKACFLDFNKDIVDDMWKERCKNVSGVEVDFERNDRLHLEFQNCVRNAINYNQAYEDIIAIVPNENPFTNYTISDRQKGDLVAFAQKYVWAER